MAIQISWLTADEAVRVGDTLDGPNWRQLNKWLKENRPDIESVLRSGDMQTIAQLVEDLEQLNPGISVSSADNLLEMLDIARDGMTQLPPPQFFHPPPRPPRPSRLVTWLTDEVGYLICEAAKNQYSYLLPFIGFRHKPLRAAIEGRDIRAIQQFILQRTQERPNVRIDSLDDLFSHLHSMYQEWIYSPSGIDLLDASEQELEEIVAEKEAKNVAKQRQIPFKNCMIEEMRTMFWLTEDAIGHLFILLQDNLQTPYTKTIQYFTALQQVSPSAARAIYERDFVTVRLLVLFLESRGTGRISNVYELFLWVRMYCVVKLVLGIDALVVQPCIIFSAQLNGVNVRTMVDTGACISLISEDTVAKMGVPNYQIHRGIVGSLTGFGTKPITGKITGLTLDIGARSAVVNALVVQQTSKNYDLLLGMDFLVEHNCEVYCGQYILRMRDMKTDAVLYQVNANLTEKYKKLLRWNFCDYSSA